MDVRKIKISPQGILVTAPKLPADIVAPKKAATIKVSLTPRAYTDRSKQGLNGHWKFDEPLSVNLESGFVYLIVDLLEDKMYIGKKHFMGAGEKNRWQESNWKWYTSSNKHLIESAKKNGKECFEYYALEQYKYRGSVGFAESWSMCHAEVFTSNRWHNGLMNKVSWSVKERITDRHKYRLDMIIQGKGHELKCV